MVIHKNYKKIFFICTAYILLLIFASACYSDKKAPDKITIQKENISKIQLQYTGTIDIPKEEILDKKEIQKIIDSLNNSTPTTIQSVNDTPTNIEEYVLVSLLDNKNEISNEGYIYKDTLGRLFTKEEIKYYFEIPYNGIYEVDESFYNHIVEKFEQKKHLKYR